MWIKKSEFELFATRTGETGPYTKLLIINQSTPQLNARTARLDILYLKLSSF